MLAGLRTVALAALLLLGCHRALRGPEREYGFVHLETTGISSGIVVPGAVRPPGTPEGFPDVLIKFSNDSDHDAVRSLGHLDGKILLANARTGIVVVGILDSKVRSSTTGPGLPASERYQEFRLSRWYLRGPFKRSLRLGTPSDNGRPGVEHDVRLNPEDFGGQVGGDLSRFVR